MSSIFRGIAFPFVRSEAGFPAPATDDALVQQSVIQCILTAKGERIMRPDFGSIAYDFVFENNTDIMADQLKIEVRNVIAKYEPRAIVRDVLVERVENELIVTVVFVVAATRKQHAVQAAIPAP